MICMLDAAINSISEDLLRVITEACGAWIKLSQLRVGT